MQSTITDLGETADEGFEQVGGRRCHQITGVAKSVSASGHEHNVRRTTLWIDAETLLIRKVFEDTPAARCADMFRGATGESVVGRPGLPLRRSGIAAVTRKAA